MMQQAITKNSLLLAAFAIFVAAGLASTEIGTRDAREASLRAVQSKALAEIVSDDQYDNILLDDFISVNDSALLKLKDEKTIHIARLKGEVTAFIFPVRAPDGYGGAIESIVGIDLNGQITGVRILKHAETPGLGDKIELKKSTWVLDFNGKDLENPSEAQWKVKKDKGIFDQFTGATITPRAVVASIHRSLQYFAANKAELIAKTQKTQQDEADSSTELEPNASTETTDATSETESQETEALVSETAPISPLTQQQKQAEE